MLDMRFRLRDWFSGFTLAVLLCAGAAGCRHPAMQQPPVPAESDSRNEAYEQIEKLTEVMLRVKKSYVEDKSFSNIVDGALQGMLNSLDEYSYYMMPEEFEEMRETTTGKYGGIGVYIGAKEGVLMVIDPIEDTPGFRAGLMAQDMIISINGESTAGITMRDAVEKLRGEPGTEVSLTIRRAKEPEPRTIKLVRENIEVPSIKGAAIIRDGIGYIRITQFTEPTADSLQKALEDLLGKGMTALVLDLRSNPGGLLTSACAVSEKFLKRDALIVSIREREDKTGKRMAAGGDHHYTDLLMVTLINGGSASASEIVAGALQDNKRAVLVGEKTYGKGSVQTVIPLETDTNCAVRLTTAKYCTPGEREFHNKGIEPDIYVPVSLEDWQKIRMRRAQIEHDGSYTEEEKAEFRDVTDPQLERAVDLLVGLKVFKDREGNKVESSK